MKIFINFNQKTSLSYLENNFCYIFNLTNEEQEVLFYKKNYVLEFSESIYATSTIRQLILEAPSEAENIDLIVENQMKVEFKD